MSDTEQNTTRKIDLTITEAVQLPVGIVINGILHKKVTVRTLTTAEAYIAMAAAEPEHLTAIIEMAAATTIDALSRTLSYDELANAPRQDSYALEAALGRLEKKQREYVLTQA